MMGCPTPWSTWCSWEARITPTRRCWTSWPTGPWQTGAAALSSSWANVKSIYRTNAWTDTDHTCYTVYTAGPSGFLHILPVYMDHILHPVLRFQFQERDELTDPLFPGSRIIWLRCITSTETARTPEWSTVRCRCALKYTCQAPVLKVKLW